MSESVELTSFSFKRPNYEFWDADKSRKVTEINTKRGERENGEMGGEKENSNCRTDFEAKHYRLEKICKFLCLLQNGVKMPFSLLVIFRALSLSLPLSLSLSPSKSENTEQITNKPHSSFS